METINELTTSVPLDTTGLNRVSITVLETRVYLLSHEPMAYVLWRKERTKNGYFFLPERTVVFSFTTLRFTKRCSKLD